MVFRKPNRPGFYVWPTLPGFGRVGPWSTGASSKALAESVDAWLREVAMSDPAVVRCIQAGKFSLRDAYVAHKERRLDMLKEKASDPALSEVIDRFRSKVTDARVEDGLNDLARLAPRGARLSWLMVPKNLSDILAIAVGEGRKVNSVHRSLYAAIKLLLVYEVGVARKRMITTDVVFRHEDDTRHVEVSPDQLGALMDQCDETLRDYILASVLTGIDQKPLLAITPSRLDLEKGEVRVPDTKAKSRFRSIGMSDAATTLFRRIAAGKEPNEPLFAMKASAYSTRFRKAREAAGLPGLRIKDLRHVFANAWVDIGGTIGGLGQALGHSRATTSLKYTTRQARVDRDRMNLVAEKLGLARPHIRIEDAG